MRHEWEKIKNFIKYLQSEIMNSNFSLIILLKEDIESLDSCNQSLLQDSLSLLINPIFNNIIDVLSHRLRKDLISLLNTEQALSYVKMMERLDIKRSSVLAFHLNKLISEGILIKMENNYSLSSKGLRFAEIIHLIEDLGFIVPQSQIKILKM